MRPLPSLAGSILKTVGVVTLIGGICAVSTAVVSDAGAQPGGTPTVHTTATIGGSGGISDSVSVVGDAAGGAPTGNVTFYLCQTGSTQTLTPGPCSNIASNLYQTVRLTTGANYTSTGASASDNPKAAGTWCFSAVYGGSTSYDSASDNTTGTNEDTNECAVVSPSSSTSTSTISAADITLGPSGTVTDTVTVQGNASRGSPTGSVTYYVCQTGTTQTLSPNYCSPSMTPQDTETLQAGANDTSDATSTSFTPNMAGTWCFSAMYSGDSNYTGSSDNTDGSNLDSNECALVGQASTTSATVISSANLTLGPSGTVTDSVTVTGNSVGGPPTGNVSFYACQTGSTQTLTPSYCTPGGNPEDTEPLAPAAVDPNNDLSDASSVAFTPSAAGTWCFSAVYGGDSNYTGSSDNTDGSNLDSNECTLVAPAGSTTSTRVSAATVTLGPSGTLTDSVTVTGNSAGGAPRGTVDFYVCGPTGSDALCSSQSNPEGTPTISAASADSSSATSDSFAPTSTGTWCFAAVYVPAPNGNYTGSSDNVSGIVDTNECAMAQSAYRITSAPSTTGTAGSKNTFEVTVTAPAGAPIPRIRRRGPLAPGMRFTDNNPSTGEGLLHGTPREAGTFSWTFTATWGKNAKKVVATQTFSMDVSS